MESVGLLTAPVKTGFPPLSTQWLRLFAQHLLVDESWTCPDCGAEHDVEPDHCDECKSVCSSYRSHVVDQDQICSTCSCCIDDHCSCYLCSSCEERFESTCSRCDECHGCCDCFICDRCEEPSETGCCDCQECHECCSCGLTCPSCGNDIGTDDDNEVERCDKCDRCFDCCQHMRVDVPWNGSRYEDADYETLFAEAGVFDLDPAMAMASFYLLEEASRAPALIGMRVPPHVERDIEAWLQPIRAEARRRLDGLVERCDEAFLAYVDAAVGGELRHHRLEGCMHPDRDVAWGQWHSIREEHGIAAVEAAVEMFEVGPWSSAFGGQRWAEIARVLLARLKGDIPPWLFVDRVFSLQHNGGSLLDKIGWAVHNRLGWKLPEMRWIGDAHHANPTRHDVLMEAADPDDAQLFRSFWIERNRRTRRFQQLHLTTFWEHVGRRDSYNPELARWTLPLGHYHWIERPQKVSA